MTTTTTTTHQTENDIVTVSTTVNIQPRRVEFSEILDSVRIESDDWDGETPWSMCDGWEHEAEVPSHDDQNASNGFVYRGNRDGGSLVITIDDNTVSERCGCNGYPGASKQVRAELAATAKRKAISQLVDWYSNGWEYWYVVGEYSGYGSSVGGVLGVEYADDLRGEIALEIAYQMEQDGYTIVGKPAPTNPTNAQCWRDSYQRQQESYVVQSR